MFFVLFLLTELAPLLVATSVSFHCLQLSFCHPVQQTAPGLACLSSPDVLLSLMRRDCSFSLILARVGYPLAGNHPIVDQLITCHSSPPGNQRLVKALDTPLPHCHLEKASTRLIFCPRLALKAYLANYCAPTSELVGKEDSPHCATGRLQGLSGHRGHFRKLLPVFACKNAALWQSADQLSATRR